VMFPISAGMEQLMACNHKQALMFTELILMIPQEGIFQGQEQWYF